MRAETLRTLAAAATALLLVSPLLAYLAGLWDEYWKVVTNLGDEPAYVALATLIYVGVSRELGVTALLALISTAWLNVLVKNVLALPRPPRELWKVEASGYGFPSGHTQTSTTFWLSVGLKLRDAYVLALGLAVALLVGASRVELGVHYPHDVVGGFLLGAAVAWLAVRAVGARGLRGARSSAALAAYGFLISLLYLAYPEPTFTKMGGVSLGLSAYPLLRDKLDARAGALARALVSLAALLVAFALTRFFDKQPPLLQLPGYALVTLVIVAAPLAYRLLGGARQA